MTAKILYIEDNVHSLQLINDLMDLHGYDLLEAYDGLSGVAVAAREKPDLILMDINLPGIDGLEATSRLKASRELSHIPIIAVTANNAYGDREACIAAGCDGYVPKPIDISLLLKTIQSFLEDAKTPH